MNKIEQRQKLRELDAKKKTLPRQYHDQLDELTEKSNELQRYMINLADEVNSYLDGDDFDYRQQTVDMIYGYQDEVKEVFNQEKNAVTDQYEEQLSKLNREIETVEETRIDDDKQ